MKEKDKKELRRIYILIFIIIAILIVITDLFLFWSSLKEEGVGSGFPRFF